MISSPGDLVEDANEIWDEGNEAEDVKRGLDHSNIVLMKEEACQFNWSSSWIS